MKTLAAAAAAIAVCHPLGGRTLTVRQELGHTAVFDNGFSLSFGVGLGVTFARGVYIPFTSVEWPFFPAAGARLSVGYAI